jgi:AraC-like DNA-binding protein
MRRITPPPSNALRITSDDIALPGFVLIGLRRYANAGPPLAPDAHPGEIEVVFLASGRQVLAQLGQEYEMRGNDLLITPPGVFHDSAGHPTEKCTLYYLRIWAHPPLLGFADEDARLVIQALSNPPAFLLKGSPQLQDVLDDVFLAYKDQKPCWKTRMQERLTAFLLGVLDSISPKQNITYSSRIEAAMKYVHEHLASEINNTDIADAVGVSVFALNRLFKDELGIPPKEYVLHQKLEIAKRRLSEPKVAITDIALELGFFSSQHFSTTFKRYMGVTPTQYLHAHVQS